MNVQAKKIYKNGIIQGKLQGFLANYELLVLENVKLVSKHHIKFIKFRMQII